MTLTKTKESLIMTANSIEDIKKILSKKGVRLGFMVYLDKNGVGLMTGSSVKDEDIGLIRLLIEQLFFT